MDLLVERREGLKNSDAEQAFKKEILDLFRDYRYPWDIYTEMIQNCVDAINSSSEDDGEIEVKINSERREITIKDNGCGIPHKELEYILIPNYSYKKSYSKTYGYKGVGFSFVAHLTEYLKIESYIDNKKNTLEVSNSIGWVARNDDKRDFSLHEEESISNDKGTKILLRFPSSFSSFAGEKLRVLNGLDELFIWSKDITILEYILRTKTAIGNVRTYFNESPIKDIKIKLIVDGDSRNVEFKYLTPFDSDYSKRKRYYLKREIDGRPSYESIFTDGSKKERDKKFNCIRHDFKGLEVGRTLKVKFDLSILICGETGLTQLEKQYNIKSDVDDNNWESFSSNTGIYLSINGMPTDICLYRWDSGFDRRFMCYVDVDMGVNGELDKGRKGISEHTKRLIKSKVEERLKEGIVGTKPVRGIRHVAAFMKDKKSKGFAGTDVTKHLQRWDEQVSIIKNMSFKKAPLDENAVISLFFELIGKGLIQGYSFRYISQDATYDFAFSYLLSDSRIHDKIEYGLTQEFLDQNRIEEKDCVYIVNGIRGVDYHIGEFKIDVESIVNSDIQPINELDLLVVWDFNEEYIEQHGGSISVVDSDERKFEGVTHVLSDESGECQVIVLKYLFDKLDFIYN